MNLDECYKVVVDYNNRSPKGSKEIPWRGHTQEYLEEVENSIVASLINKESLGKMKTILKTLSEELESQKAVFFSCVRGKQRNEIKQKIKTLEERVNFLLYEKDNLKKE